MTEQEQPARVIHVRSYRRVGVMGRAYRFVTPSCVGCGAVFEPGPEGEAEAQEHAAGCEGFRDLPAFRTPSPSSYPETDPLTWNGWCSACAPAEAHQGHQEACRSTAKDEATGEQVEAYRPSLHPQVHVSLGAFETFRWLRRACQEPSL